MDSQRPKILLKATDRNAAAMVWLVAALPLWGLLFDLIIWLGYRQSNRRVVFQAQQAIVLHALLLLVFVCFCLMLILVNVLHSVNPQVALLLREINRAILLFCGALYFILCGWGFGAILFFQQDDFTLPLIGRQLCKNVRSPG